MKKLFFKNRPRLLMTVKTIIAALLLLAAYLLMQKPWVKYAAYYDDTSYGSYPFTSDVLFRNVKEEADSPPKQISIPLGDSVVMLGYDTAGSGYHNYRSGDARIECMLEQYTEGLLQLTIWNPEELPAFSVTSQAAFESFVEYLISDWFAQDWERYTATCTSRRSAVTGENSQIETVDGFLLPEDGEKVWSYKLRYGAFDDGESVYGRVVVTYYIDSSMLTVTVLSHLAETEENAELDMKGIRDSIDALFRYHMRPGSKVHSYECSNESVFFFNGQRYYECWVDLQWQSLRRNGEMVDESSLFSVVCETGVYRPYADGYAPLKPYEIVEE